MEGEFSEEKFFHTCYPWYDGSLFMFQTIVLYIVSLIILYEVIQHAVKSGINRSKVGQFLEEKYGMREKETSPFDDDSDAKK